MTAPVPSALWKSDARFNRELLERWLAQTDLAGLHELAIDFGETAWFDIAALTFLLAILSNARSNGVRIMLRLPEIPANQKARDFLHRWEFKDALRFALDNELANVLPLDQLSYFDAPRQNYLSRNLMDEYGNLTVLSSLRLLEISSLTELNPDGNYRVSFSKIGEVTNNASANVLRSALQSALGASFDWAAKFGNVLIHQALLNAFEHPGATVAYIAMACEGTNLIVAVVDNGLTIPDTISESYENYARQISSPSEKLSPYRLDAERIAFATNRGTSRKHQIESSDSERGMGLYYSHVPPAKPVAC